MWNIVIYYTDRRLQAIDVNTTVSCSLRWEANHDQAFPPMAHVVDIRYRKHILIYCIKYWGHIKKYQNDIGFVIKCSCSKYTVSMVSNFGV